MLSLDKPHLDKVRLSIFIKIMNSCSYFSAIWIWAITTKTYIIVKIKILEIAKYIDIGWVGGL